MAKGSHSEIIRVHKEFAQAIRAVSKLLGLNGVEVTKILAPYVIEIVASHIRRREAKRKRKDSELFVLPPPPTF